MKKLRNLLPVMCLLSAFSLPVLAAQRPFIDWSNLHNPILSYPDWSIKDPAMAYRDGTFYVFFSAFYEDRGRVRSHVVEVSTRDFKVFSSPILDFDGREEGWVGMCSPDVQKLGNLWELSIDSWDSVPYKAEKKAEQVFYMTSPDLVHWSPRHPLAPNLTTNAAVYDLSVIRNSSGYYAVWVQGNDPHDSPVRPPRLAASPSLNGPWRFVDSGFPSLKMSDGKENGLTHENFEFIRFDGVLHMLSSDYLPGRHHYLYTLLDSARPLDWGNGFELEIPQEDFNRMVPGDAAALYDWRKYDGYFYLLYAGRNEQTTYLHRGWNRLALARSKDLKHWVPAGVNP